MRAIRKCDKYALTRDAHIQLNRLWGSTYSRTPPWTQVLDNELASIKMMMRSIQIVAATGSSLLLPTLTSFVSTLALTYLFVVYLTSLAVFQVRIPVVRFPEQVQHRFVALFEWVCPES